MMDGFTLNMSNYFYPVITYYVFEPDEKYHQYSYEEKIKIRKCVNKDFENDKSNNLLEM